MTAINANRAIRGPVTAVPLVAGNGVRLTADVENNRWVAEIDDDFIVTTEETVGTYSVGSSDVNISKTISKAGYKPVAWMHKFAYAGAINFNEESTTINENNELVFQGYARSSGGTVSITFKLFVTWVKASN